MPYCTLAQVQAEFKSLTINETSPVSTSDVNRFIEEADQEIDSRIGVRYAVPIQSAPKSLVILRTISIGLVTQRIREIVRVRTTTPAGSQDARDGNPGREAREKLDLIAKGMLLLPDASLARSEAGVASFNVKSGQEHFFKKGVDQW